MLIKKISLFRAKAGFPSPALDYAEDALDLNKLLVKHPASTFLVESDGDSMAGAFVSDPALLLVDRALQVQNEDIVLASINGDFTIKFYQRRGTKIRLIPANPKYNPIEIIDGMEFAVFGVVSRIIIDPRKLNNVRTGRL